MVLATFFPLCIWAVYRIYCRTIAAWSGISDSKVSDTSHVLKSSTRCLHHFSGLEGRRKNLTPTLQPQRPFIPRPFQLSLGSERRGTCEYQDRCLAPIDIVHCTSQGLAMMPDKKYESSRLGLGNKTDWSGCYKTTMIQSHSRPGQVGSSGSGSYQKSRTGRTSGGCSTVEQHVYQVYPHTDSRVQAHARPLHPPPTIHLTIDVSYLCSDIDMDYHNCWLARDLCITLCCTESDHFIWTSHNFEQSFPCIFHALSFQIFQERWVITSPIYEGMRYTCVR